MKIYNSLSKKVEKFRPISKSGVSMYSCGMTVYDYAHIGHGRKYVTDDLLRRTMQFNGYKVKFVQNVTDVGHLTSDQDEGEDKLEKGAKKAGKTVWEVASFFQDHFYSSMDKLNIIRPDIITKATDNIPEQIELVKKLIEKGFAYETPEAVYFDVSKFSKYGRLFGQKLEDKKVAVRKGVKTGLHKKNPQDFSLWFKRIGRFRDHAMHWDSPWGDGFPGWHVECSAMSMKFLGEQIDIHTGGEDHISIHHPNEIAQSESATGKSPFVKYWVHTQFLTVDNTKMSKSLGNFYTIEDVEEKGFDSLSLRYLYLGTHYKKKLNFTWEALENAQNSLAKLENIVVGLKREKTRTRLSDEKLRKLDKLKAEFREAINNDLNIAGALALTWRVAKSNIPSIDKLETILLFDEVLGLGLGDIVEKQIPKNISDLMEKRNKLRDNGEYDAADRIRDEIVSLGYQIQDK